MARSRVGRGTRRIFIADSNVLIDYLNADFAVLGRFSKRVGEVFVLKVLVREEVNGLDEAQCEAAGLTVSARTIEGDWVALEARRGV